MVILVLPSRRHSQLGPGAGLVESRIVPHTSPPWTIHRQRHPSRTLHPLKSKTDQFRSGDDNSYLPRSMDLCCPVRPPRTLLQAAAANGVRHIHLERIYRGKRATIAIPGCFRQQALEYARSCMVSFLKRSLSLAAGNPHWRSVVQFI